MAERGWSTAWEESSHIQLGRSWGGGCQCHIWQQLLHQPKIQYYVKCVTSQQYICGVQYLKFTQLCWQQRMFGPEPFKGVFYKTSPFQNDSPKPIPKLSLHLKGLLIDAFVAKVCGEVPHFHHLWPLPCTEERRFHSRVKRFHGIVVLLTGQHNWCKIRLRFGWFIDLIWFGF